MMQAAIKTIRRSNSPLVVGHVNPDADCIASVLVMHTALRSMGKEARMILPRDMIAKKFAFMFDLVPAGNRPDQHDKIDLMLVVDTALRSRIALDGAFAPPDAVTICSIDHHLGNEGYGHVNWVDSDSASCTQMVFSLLEALGVPITPGQAGLLYAGLHGDTCGFSLRGTSKSALAAAARLTELGADVPAICQKMYRTMSRQEFALMRLVYENTRVSPSGQVAWSTVTHDELLRAGCSPADIDEQVCVPRSIEAVRIAILFSEPAAARVRMNLRSEDSLNILPLAKSLGGGGHAQAAGIMMDGDMKTTVERVVAQAEEYLRRVDSEPDAVERANVCR